MNEAKSVRSRRVGSGRGVCGVARLVRGINLRRSRAPCIRCLTEPTRLTRNTQTGSFLTVKNQTPKIARVNNVMAVGAGAL